MTAPTPATTGTARRVVTDDDLDRHELALVFYARGRTAHLMVYGEVNSTLGDGPVCRRVPRWHVPLGTGSQDEWERARELPLCRYCRAWWRD